MSLPKCLFFQDLEGLTEVFGHMSTGISGPKLPLWADCVPDEIRIGVGGSLEYGIAGEMELSLFWL